MQVTNIRTHRIRWRHQLARGAMVGVVSITVLLLATVLVDLIFGTTDDSALAEVAGSVGLAVFLNFAIGIVAGMIFAALVALFDVEGWTPVAVAGLLYGAVVFVWPATIAGFDGSSLIVMFAGSIAFGLAAGLLLATWADRGDIDQDETERVPAFEGDGPETHRHLIG